VPTSTTSFVKLLYNAPLARIVVNNTTPATFCCQGGAGGPPGSSFSPVNFGQVGLNGYVRIYLYP